MILRNCVSRLRSQFAPSFAFHLDLVLVFQPFAFTKDLQTGAVHHQMNRPPAGRSPPHWRQSQSLAPTRQGGEIRHGNFNSHQRRDTAHQALGLTQRQFVNNTHGQAHRNRQVRVFRLAATRRPALGRPLRKRLIAHLDSQITTLAKAFIISRPVRDLKLLLGYLVPTVFIELMRHPNTLGPKTVAWYQIRADPRNTANAWKFRDGSDPATDARQNVQAFAAPAPNSSRAAEFERATAQGNCRCNSRRRD
ncbi:hypothetical protein ABIA10_006229 [Rhizobium leguminosarum]